MRHSCFQWSVTITVQLEREPRNKDQTMKETFLSNCKLI